MLWRTSSLQMYLVYIYSYNEAEFLDVIGTKVLRVSSLLFTVTSTNRFTSSPLSKSGLKLICNLNTLYKENLKSENSHDNAQKPHRNCTFMNSASNQKVLLGEVKNGGQGAWETGCPPPPLQEQPINYLNSFVAFVTRCVNQQRKKMCSHNLSSTMSYL